jgi:GDPmannose 4,6-dehydratase
VNENGYIKYSTSDYAFEIGQEVVCIDPKYFRLTEVYLLIGAPTKAQQKLGLTPKYSLQQLVTEMVQANVKAFQQERILIESGYQVARQYE